MVSWKQIKPYQIFPIPPDSIIFFWCNSAFDVCGGFVKWNSFTSCWIQISSILMSPRGCIWQLIVDFVFFNISSISRTVSWRSDSIMALIWSSWTSFGRPELRSYLSEKFPKRNWSNQFRHCLSFKAFSPYTSRNFLAAYATFFPLRK